jgi:hypothetical protein
MITRIPAALPVTLPVTNYFVLSNKIKNHRIISKEMGNY